MGADIDDTDKAGRKAFTRCNLRPHLSSEGSTWSTHLPPAVAARHQEQPRPPPPPTAMAKSAKQDPLHCSTPRQHTLFHRDRCPPCYLSCYDQEVSTASARLTPPPPPWRLQCHRTERTTRQATVVLHRANFIAVTVERLVACSRRSSH
jgi:hypothetical protein